MTTAVAQVILPNLPSSLSADDLTRFASTFNDARQAVWVHDLAGRCVYRNPIARKTSPCAAKDALHDILDHEDRRIGHLRLRMS
jgi:PAS domain-containing protein